MPITPVQGRVMPFVHGRAAGLVALLGAGVLAPSDHIGRAAAQEDPAPTLRSTTITNAKLLVAGESTPPSTDPVPVASSTGAVEFVPGTAFVYTLSKPSRVTIELERLRPTLRQCRSRPSLAGCGIRVGAHDPCRRATAGRLRGLRRRIGGRPSVRRLRSARRAKAIAVAVHRHRCVLPVKGPKVREPASAPSILVAPASPGSIAALTRDRPAGPNGTTFTGRIDSTALPRGAYRATLTAVDDAGRRSEPSTLAFSIVGAGAGVAAGDDLACGVPFASLDCAVVGRIEPGCAGRVSVLARAGDALIRTLDFAQDPDPAKCNPIKAATLSPDKSTVAVVFYGGDFGSDIQLIRLADEPQAIRIIRIGSYYHELSFSPSGEQLIAGASLDAAPHRYAVADAQPPPGT